MKSKIMDVPAWLWGLMWGQTPHQAAQALIARACVEHELAWAGNRFVTQIEHEAAMDAYLRDHEKRYCSKCGAAKVKR